MKQACGRCSRAREATFVKIVLNWLSAESAQQLDGGDAAFANMASADATDAPNATAVEYDESLERCSVDEPRLAAVKEYR